jgi:ligand-binding sensor domain-containing protein
MWGGVVVLGAASALGSMLLPNLLAEHSRWKHEAPVIRLVDPDRESTTPTPADDYDLSDALVGARDLLPEIEVHLAATMTDPDDTRAAVAGADALWVATGGGLLRVPYANPEQAVHWTTADGLPDHRLTALTGDDELLVAGTESGAILWLDPSAALDGTGAPRVTAFAEVSNARISDLLIDDGALYVATWGEGIFVGDVADPRLFRPVGPAHGMKSRRVTSLAMLDGELLAGTAGGGVWVRSADGKSRRYVAKGGLAGNFVLDLTIHRGRAVAATTGGISRYRRGSWRTDRSWDGTVPPGVIRAVGVDTDGSLALSASGGRLGGLGSSQAIAIPAPPDGLGPWNGVPRPEVRWLTAGGGHLFAGTERGLLRRGDDGEWTWLTHPGPGSNDITSVHAQGGALLVGTFDRGAWIRDPVFQQWSALALPSGEVNGVLLDDAGRPWAATSAGLVRVDEGGSRAWTTLHGLRSNHVSAVRPARSGLWIGSTGGLQRFDGVGFSGPVGLDPDGEGPSHIYDVVADGDTVWVGTLEGLWRIDTATEDGPASAQRFRYAAGELPDDWINAVVVGADGTVWAGTYDHGLAFRSPGGPWRSLSEPDGLPCGWVNPGAMAALPDGSVLVGTLGGGLLRVGTGGLIDQWTMRDGLAGDDVTSVAVDGDQVHIGTRSGISRLVMEAPPVSALADRS